MTERGLRFAQGGYRGWCLRALLSQCWQRKFKRQIREKPAPPESVPMPRSHRHRRQDGG